MFLAFAAGGARIGYKRSALETVSMITAELTLDIKYPHDFRHRRSWGGKECMGKEVMR